MKCVLIVATGILIGEKKTEDSAKIIKSVWFDESLEQFISKDGEKIVEYLNQTEEEIISDNSQIVDFLRQVGFANARFAGAGELTPFRALITDFIRDNMKIEPSATIFSVIRDKAMQQTRMLLREKVEARDVYVAQAIKSIDDVNSINPTLTTRVKTRVLKGRPPARKRQSTCSMRMKNTKILAKKTATIFLMKMMTRSMRNAVMQIPMSQPHPLLTIHGPRQFSFSF